MRNCREMGQIYTSGKELCEKMWGTAFRYERNAARTACRATFMASLEMPSPTFNMKFRVELHSGSSTRGRPLPASDRIGFGSDNSTDS